MLARLRRLARGPGKKAFRGNLISKRGPKNFYKGRGAPASKMGKHTAWGFKIDPEKAELYTFKAPDLTDFKLKPYVEIKK